MIVIEGNKEMLNFVRKSFRITTISLSENRIALMKGYFSLVM